MGDVKVGERGWRLKEEKRLEVVGGEGRVVVVIDRASVKVGERGWRLRERK